MEHLRGVLRELSVTRGEAMRLKVHLAESLQGLQEEYARCVVGGGGMGWPGGGL